MKLSFKKLAATGAVVFAAAASTLVAATPASATNMVDCQDGENFLKIHEDKHQDWCFANPGYEKFGQLTRTFWATEISTGNNDIRWKADGVWHDLGRWSVLTFPTVGSVRLQEIEIK